MLQVHLVQRRFPNWADRIDRNEAQLRVGGKDAAWARSADCIYNPMLVMNCGRYTI